MAEQVSTVDNPTNTDVSSTGDAATQMVQGYQDKYAPSTGDSISTEGQTSSTDDTGQPEPVTSQPDNEGKVTRLEQELTKQKQFVANLLGTPVNSDIVDQVSDGVITIEQARKMVGTTAQQPTDSTQPADPSQKLTTLINDVKKRGSASVEDFVAGLETVAALNQDYRQQQDQANWENNLLQCQNAAQAVIDKDEIYAALPDDIRELTSQIHIGATDNLLARETKGDPTYLTPRSYSHWGQKNLQRLNTLRDYWIEQGRKSERDNIAKGTTRTGGTPISPMSPGTGGSPATPPGPVIKLDNMAEVARAYRDKRAIV